MVAQDWCGLTKWQLGWGVRMDPVVALPPNHTDMPTEIFERLVLDVVQDRCGLVILELGPGVLGCRCGLDPV